MGRWNHPGQLAYGLAILLSKAMTRLGWHRLAGWPAACVAFLLIRRHRADVVLAEFGFHAVRVMNACVWSDVPLVVHFRGSDASAHRRLTLLRERYRRLMHLSSALLAKSLAMKDVLVGLGPIRRRSRSLHREQMNPCSMLMIPPCSRLTYCLSAG